MQPDHCGVGTAGPPDRGSLRLHCRFDWCANACTDRARTGKRITVRRRRLQPGRKQGSGETWRTSAVRVVPTRNRRSRPPNASAGRAAERARPQGCALRCGWRRNSSVPRMACRRFPHHATERCRGSRKSPHWKACLPGTRDAGSREQVQEMDPVQQALVDEQAPQCG